MWWYATCCGPRVVLIQLLLPTPFADPSGKTVEATSAFRDTRRELTDRFTGLTAYVRAPARGTWTAPGGRTEQDDVVMVEVAADSFDREWWRDYAATLATRFRQDVIHVRALPIELLDEASQ